MAQENSLYSLHVIRISLSLSLSPNLLYIFTSSPQPFTNITLNLEPYINIYIFMVDKAVDKAVENSPMNSRDLV